MNFNAFAPKCSTRDRRALVEAMWKGEGRFLDPATNDVVAVTPDTPAQPGEHLFYIAFMGSKRDKIPTQHYLVAATDAKTAVPIAIKLYEKEPRRRKGASLRVLVGAPPELLAPPDSRHR